MYRDSVRFRAYIFRTAKFGKAIMLFAETDIGIFVVYSSDAKAVTPDSLPFYIEHMTNVAIKTDAKAVTPDSLPIVYMVIVTVNGHVLSEMHTPFAIRIIGEQRDSLTSSQLSNMVTPYALAVMANVVAELEKLDGDVNTALSSSILIEAFGNVDCSGNFTNAASLDNSIRIQGDLGGAEPSINVIATPYVDNSAVTAIELSHIVSLEMSSKISVIRIFKLSDYDTNAIYLYSNTTLSNMCEVEI